MGDVALGLGEGPTAGGEDWACRGGGKGSRKAWWSPPGSRRLRWWAKESVTIQVTVKAWVPLSVKVKAKVKTALHPSPAKVSNQPPGRPLAPRADAPPSPATVRRARWSRGRSQPWPRWAAAATRAAPDAGPVPLSNMWRNARPAILWVSLAPRGQGRSARLNETSLRSIPTRPRPQLLDASPLPSSAPSCARALVRTRMLRSAASRSLHRWASANGSPSWPASS